VLFDVVSDLIKMNINPLKTHTKRKYFSVQCSPTHEKALLCVKVLRFSFLFLLKRALVVEAIIIIIIIAVAVVVVVVIVVVVVVVVVVAVVG